MSTTHRFRTSLTAVVALAALTLGACSSPEEVSQTNGGAADQNTSASESEGKTVIKHAFGETEINGKPQRIATVAWGNHEVPLALGVVPVGMSKATWGDDNGDGILPWVDEKLKELGGEAPELFDETDGLPFEQIANTQPDVILATYSGITQEDYEQLSKIAPTVAYPDVAWSATYEQMIEMNSKAIGKEEEGKKYLEDINNQIDETFAKFPELQGKKILFTAFGQDDMSEVGFYTTHDTRVSFPLAHGLVAPKAVEDASAKTDEFWTTVSAENPEMFDDVDIIVSYGSNDESENQKLLKKLQSDPLIGKIRAVKEGNVAFLGEDPLAASANPSPLSIPSTLDEYLATLASAAK